MWKHRPLLAGLADEIDAAMAEAVKGLRAHGYSWSEIGVRLGISRQAVQERWESSSRPIASASEWGSGVPPSCPEPPSTANNHSGSTL